MAKKRKSTLKTYIMNTADRVYSEYIRKKEANRHGYCACVTCGVTRKWNDRMDAGHYVNRDDWPTRFDDKNVHPQCQCCNRRNSGRRSRYAVYLKNRYGPMVLDRLDRKSRLVKQFTLDDLKGWVKEWKAEIDKMAIVKNL